MDRIKRVLIERVGAEQIANCAFCHEKQWTVSVGMDT